VALAALRVHTPTETFWANASRLERVQHVATYADPATIGTGPPAAERTANMRIARAAYASIYTNYVLESGRGARHHLFRQLSGYHFIHVAPHPSLSRLDGPGQWMRLVLCMLARMAILGGIAASYLPAIGAQAKMDPGISQLHALLTNMLRRSSDMQMVQMAAR
jgi:hypothetical protein